MRGHVDWGRAFGADGELPSLWLLASNAVIDQDMPEEQMRRLMSAACRCRALWTRVNNPPRSFRDVPVQSIAINGYRLAALPGEVLVEIPSDWRERNRPSPAFAVSFANGHFQYLAHARNFQEAGWGTRYETIANSLTPEAAAILLDKAESLLHAGQHEENRLP